MIEISYAGPVSLEDGGIRLHDAEGPAKCRLTVNRGDVVILKGADVSLMQTLEVRSALVDGEVGRVVEGATGVTP